MKTMKTKFYLILGFLILFNGLNVIAQGLGSFTKIEDFAIGNDVKTNIIFAEEQGKNILLMGIVSGQNGNVQTHFGGWDIFICKLDSNRNVVFQKTIGGTNDDVLKDVVKDSLGNYHLFSMSNSRISGSKTVSETPQSTFPNHKATYEVYHVILDSNYNTIAEKTHIPLTSPSPPLLIDAREGTRIWDIKAEYMSIDNSILFVYAFGIDWNITNPSNAGWSGVIVKKIDVNGNVINSSGFSGPSTNDGCGINTPITKLGLKSLSTNDLILTYNLPRVLCSPSSTGNISKIALNGNITGGANYRAGWNTLIGGVEEKSNGNILFICRSEATQTLDRTVAPRIGGSPTDNYDIWVFETNPSLVKQNEWAFGTDKGIRSSSNVYTTSKNNSLLIFSTAYGGGPFGTGLDKTETIRGGSDYWLLDVDINNMSIFNDKSFGGSQDEYSSGLLLTDNYFYYLGYSFSGPLAPDKTAPKISIGLSNYDAWIVKSNICNIQTPHLTGMLSNGNPLYYYSNVCGAEEQTFQIQNPNNTLYYYEWSDASYNYLDTGNTYLKDHPTTAYVLVKGETNYVRAISKIDGCASDYRQINSGYAEYQPAPGLFNAPLPVVCKNDSVLLVADVSVYSNNPFNWYQYNDNTPFSTANNTYSLPLYQDTTKIYLSAMDSACSKYGPMLVCTERKYCETQRLEINAPTEIADLPVTNSAPSFNCINDSVTFIASNNPNLTHYNWYNDLYYNDSIGTGSIFGYRIPDTDTIYVVGYNSNGCPSSPVPLIMNTNELYPSFTTTATTIVEGGYLYFTNTTTSKYGITGYQWEFEDGLVNNDTNTYHYFYQPGLNDVTLTVSDSSGCTTSKIFKDHINVTPCMCNRTASGLRVYPTLVENHITIELELESLYEIKIYDLMGRLFLEKNTTETYNYLNNIYMPKGTYIVTITGTNGFFGSSKIIKL